MNRPVTLAVLLVAALLTAGPALGQKYAPPASPRATYNFNPGWKFAFGDAAGADQPEFDDSAWANVSLPHTWNETDSYRSYISHSGGDRGEKNGIGWYRKHFKLPASADGQKVFLQFDGLRQARAVLPQREADRQVRKRRHPGGPRNHKVRQIRQPGQPPCRQGQQ